MCVIETGSKDNLVYSGGYDGHILRWKVDVSNIQQDISFMIDLTTVDKVDHGIISLSVDFRGDQFLIGTRSAEIF